MSCFGNSYLSTGLSELCHINEEMQMKNHVLGSEAYCVILRQRQQKYTLTNLTNFSQEGQVKMQTKQLFRKLASKDGITISLISHVLHHSGPPPTNNMKSDYNYVRKIFIVYLFPESLYYKNFF